MSSLFRCQIDVSGLPNQRALFHGLSHTSFEERDIRSAEMLIEDFSEGECPGPWSDVDESAPRHRGRRFHIDVELHVEVYESSLAEELNEIPFGVVGERVGANAFER